MARPAKALREAQRTGTQLRQAQMLLGQGRTSEAERLIDELLAHTPGDADALHVSGILYLQTGRIAQSVERLGRAAAAAPRSAAVHANLGAAFYALSRLGDALASFDKAIACDPNFTGAHNNRANVLNDLGRHEEALAACDRTVALKAGFVEAHNNRGIALEALERDDEALASYRKAVALKPDFADAFANMGTLLTAHGKLDDAYAAYARAVELAPQRAKFHRLLAGTGRIAKDSGEARRIEALARRMSALSGSDKMELSFALGSLHEKWGEQEQAFEHFLAANRLKRASFTYDEAATFASFARIRAAFPADALAEERTSGLADATPIFVVGMPRSGTTLVEQILASHGQVHGAGEVLHLRRMMGSLSHGVARFPEAVAQLSKDDLTALANQYLTALRSRAPDAEHIIDKLPDNFLRIGLIRLLFPRAKIVHVRRDAVDTCLSCFSHLFAGHLPYAYDLAELGRFYRAYESLMDHWRSALPPGVMLDVRYEDVVRDLEGESRRLLAHCGLAWDARCLDFHRREGAVRTASAGQVRRPLHADGIGRRRGPWAKPLLDALDLPP